MAGIKIDGTEVELQDAFDALSTKVKNLQETLEETVCKADAHNKTDLTVSKMDETLGAAQRPYFDLVSSIPSYDGDRADMVVPFFEHIDGVAELSGWTDAQKLQVIKLKLTGGALQFFKCDEKCKSATTSEEMRLAIVERFGESLPDHYYYEQLASIRQNRGETIEQFADRVKRTCDKTVRTTQNDEVNKVLKEDADRRAMEAFVRGLYGEIGRQTRIKFPKTYKEAVSIAVALKNLEIRPGSEENPRRVFNVKPNQTCYNCGRLGHLAKDCRLPARASHSGAVPRQPGITCNYCKRRGHTEDKCRQKLSRPTCTNCNKIGHTTESCWFSNRNRSTTSNDRRGGYSGRGRQEGQQQQSENFNGATRSAAGNPNPGN
jgi:hypothetical protein